LCLSRSRVEQNTSGRGKKRGERNLTGGGKKRGIEDSRQGDKKGEEKEGVQEVNWKTRVRV